MSYSRTESAAIQQIEPYLRSAGLALWRDQASLYGGDRWPVKLGEAIASSAAVLLVWSASAASSDWVEFEWSTAVALRKRVVILRLDDTPLPASLAGVHALGIQDAAQLANSLSPAVTARETPSRPAVLKGLDALDVATPERALEAVGPFMVHRISRLWALLLASAFLTAGLGYVSFRPRRYKLEGTVYSRTGSVLPGVVVTLPEFSLRTKTNDFGRFSFTLPSTSEHHVKLLAAKSGYQTRNYDPMLGDTNFEFRMIEEK